MFHKAYQCLWCRKNLKGDEIPTMAKSYYPLEDTNFTNAIELLGKGWECSECDCRWDFEGKIFRDGTPELKDKYKIEKVITETECKPNTKNIENNNLNNESEERLNEK